MPGREENHTEKGVTIKVNSVKPVWNNQGTELSTIKIMSANWSTYSVHQTLLSAVALATADGDDSDDDNNNNY